MAVGAVLHPLRIARPSLDAREVPASRSARYEGAAAMSSLELTACILVVLVAGIVIGVKRPRARMSVVYQMLRHGRGRWLLPPLATKAEKGNASSPDPSQAAASNDEALHE